MTRTGRRMMNRFARFARNARGVAAVEFALIAPVMLVLYMGTVEFQDYFTMDRKLTATTSAAADVVSQDDVITNSEIGDIFSAISTMMTPYDSSALKLRVSRVDIDSDSNVTVGWSDGQNYAPRAIGSTYPLPVNLVVKNSSYIVAESQFTYKAALGEYIPGGITLKRVFYVNPRYVDQVMRTP
ncbi:MAG: hypothetical protein C0605_13785 [Hyphomicrobiales bacterium]|nr:MAG: hypothetical protein C0605_13785 [Hyphomicrobiales bacterium]